MQEVAIVRAHRKVRVQLIHHLHLTFYLKSLTSLKCYC